MKAEEYFALVEAFNFCIREMNEHLNTPSINGRVPNEIDVKDLLYAICGIIPNKVLFTKNGYHRAQDKNLYKKSRIKYVRDGIGYYAKHRYLQEPLKTQFNVIADGLSEGVLTLGQTRLIIPNYMKTNFEENWMAYDDGKAILVEVLNYWKGQFFAHEFKDEFNSYKPYVKPKKVYTKPYTGTISSFYDDDLEGEAERAASQVHYDDDYLSVDRREPDDRPPFDEDASNWSYNERHDY